MSLRTQYKILPALSSLRHSCLAIVSLMVVPFLLASSAECTAKVLSAPGLKNVIESVEKNLGGRVGVALLDVRNASGWYYRADERFPMASTSKALVCALLLKSGPAALTKKVKVLESDILEYAPVSKTLTGQYVTASDLCAATMRTSDNTAVNEVLDTLGGPKAVTAFLRQIGDTSTRLDRNEPTLNEGRPGDVRDTTTPRAMAKTLQELIFGDTLNQQARSTLINWLKGNEVGGPLLRAGLPNDWQIADRTGAGGFGTRGVVAAVWPTGRSPVVIVIYLTNTKASMEQRNAAIARIGREIAATLRV